MASSTHQDKLPAEAASAKKTGATDRESSMIAAKLLPFGRRLVAGLALLGAMALQVQAQDQIKPVRVVTDNNYPPYVFLGPDGKAQGYVVDLWKLWEQKAGIPVDFRAMQWSRAQRSMLDGEADVIEMIFRTPAREQLYSFSPPYANLPVAIYVDASIHGIHDSRSLQGFRVGVQKGDACVDKLASEGVSDLAVYPNYEAILNAARAGDIKLFCMDEAPANYYLYLYRDSLQFAKAYTLYEGQFHWAVNSGDTQAFDTVSRGMSLITSGEREALREKWLKQPLQFHPYLRVVLTGALTALALLGAALLWIRTLRRQVSRKTAEIAHSNTLLEAQTRELQLEKAQLRAIIESSPDVLAVKDARGAYVEFNDAMARAMNLPREQLLGRTDSELFADKEFVADVRRLDQVAEHSEKPYAYEEELVTPDGVRRELEIIKTPIRSSDGVTAGLLVTARDITERRRAEREMRMAAVAFESHDGILIKNAQREIERVNASFTRISGYAAEELIGRRTDFLISPRHEPGFHAEIWGAVATHGHWTGEVYLRQRDGNDVATRGSLTVVKDPLGRPTHYVWSFEDISAELAAREAAEHLKLFDSLTDLPNRDLLRDRVSHALVNSERLESYCALIMLDLDLFQKINDSLGHHIGDQVIVEAARRIKAGTRQGDTLCRFSGDSFVLMLENLGKERHIAASHAADVAQALRTTIAAPMVLDGHRISCTASLGITLFSGGTATLEALLREAELAMYRSKTVGRNAIHFFEEEMQSALDRRNWIETELRHALERDQLALYYQIQVDAKGRPLGAEALLCWIHPVEGVISPGDFIPVAEETGLIEPIGRWVLTTACRQLAQWSTHEATRHLSLAVNVSSRQLKSGDFVDFALEITRKSGVSPRQLKLELTESLAIDVFESSAEKLQTLAGHGFPISLDDFGTGNSSLKYLTQLPLSQLKIDKSFVDHLPASQRDGMVAATIVAMGRGLGLHVIAEGVETRAQRDFLDGLGCHAFQGYLFGKPGPAEHVSVQLRAALAASPDTATRTP